MDETKVTQIIDVIANIKMTVKTISKICDCGQIEPEIAYMCTFLEQETKRFDTIIKE